MRTKSMRFVWLIIGLLLAGAIAACSASGSGEAASTSVKSATTVTPGSPSHGSHAPSTSPSHSSSASAKPSAEPSKDDHPKPSGEDDRKDDRKDDDRPSPSASEKPSAEPQTSPSATSPSPASSTGEPPGSQAETVTVEIKDFTFSPSEISIAPGTKVKFVNLDNVKHSAVADGGTFDTGMLDQNESQTITFEDEGTFSYYCDPHTGMTGKIVVNS